MSHHAKPAPYKRLWLAWHGSGWVEICLNGRGAERATRRNTWAHRLVWFSGNPHTRGACCFDIKYHQEVQPLDSTGKNMGQSFSITQCFGELNINIEWTIACLITYALTGSFFSPATFKGMTTNSSFWHMQSWIQCRGIILQDWVTSSKDIVSFVCPVGV